MEVFVKIIICLFMAISGYIIGMSESLLEDDEGRIVAQVVAVIGFVMFTVIILIL